MKNKHLLLIISLLILFLVAFTPAETVYFDDFEYPINEIKLKRVYQVWESGALLNFFLEQKIVNSGGKSLGVEIVSANPHNNSMTGSIFHTMGLFQGDWSGSSGTRFWISNPNESPLLISFNLKERYREYWAVAESGIFYFEDETGLITQQEIYYSNLVVPAHFQGTVIIPFDSLEVPEWNTAQTNNVLDLNRIESYAFSVMVGKTTPLYFYIDDFEVFGETTFYTLVIEGEKNIQIPQSGELLESFTAQLGILGKQSSENVTVNWSIRKPHDPMLNITEDGVLRIPADLLNTVITLVAKYNSPEFSLTTTRDVILEGGKFPEDQETSMVETLPSVDVRGSSYDTYSLRFAKWTTENRPLFVVLLILGLMVFLFLLSSIQNKLK